MNGDGQKNAAKSSRASLHATLRAAVCAYLLYLAYGIIKGMSKSAMPPWAAYAAAAVFTAAAAIYAVYTLRRYRKDTRPDPDEKEPENNGT